VANFVLLKDPACYVADDWDMAGRAASRGHWLDLFEAHFAETLKLAASNLPETSAPNVARASEEFSTWMARLRRDPTALDSGRLTGMDLDRLRERVMRENELGDPYRRIKDRENALAVSLYGDLTAQLDAMSDGERWPAMVRGIFAGNRFDLGAQSIRHGSQRAPDFFESFSGLKPRPWRVDDLDALAADLQRPGRWAKAVVFVDNAGGDFVLGIVPFVRALAACGTQIVLAANEGPALNDITIAEAHDVLARLGRIDEVLAAQLTEGRIRAVSSGGRFPMIDLANVSDELNDAARDADLVILEGMGRAIESNYDAQFTVDSLHLALLKDEEIAGRIGGELYDCVCKYRPLA